jgi:hypothetical protein
MSNEPDSPKPGADTTQYAGPDRRQPEVLDRRAVRRGGRRTTDMFKRVAGFVHALLTEPPR